MPVLKLMAIGVALSACAQAPITPPPRVGLASSADAGGIAPCKPVAGAEDVAFKEAPLSVQQSFNSQFSPFALPGEPFDATDIVRTGLSRRLIWVRHLGARWVVSFESGGREYSVRVLIYELALDGSAFQQGSVLVFPDTVCQVTNAELTRQIDSILPARSRLAEVTGLLTAFRRRQLF